MSAERIQLHKIKIIVMRLFLLLSLFFIFGKNVSAQVDTIAFKTVLKAFDKALLEKDSITLSKMLHEKVTYGHSNGWVETKKDIFKNQRTGYLRYDKIENSSSAIQFAKNWASVRTKTHAEGNVNGTDFNVDLNVLQVWMYSKKGWQLIARQGAKQ